MAFSKGGFKATKPKKTIVFEIPKESIDRIRTLLAAYAIDMPQELAEFMRIIDTKLGQSNVD